MLSRPGSWGARSTRFAATIGPAIALAALHQGRHPGASGIITASGAVTAPSVAVFGVGFLVLTAAGAVLAVRDARARLVLVFLAATLALAVVLGLLEARAGSGSHYMAFKMLYLAILPAAALGALALARAADA